MRCLYCGKELALLKRLRGGGEFCSDVHRQQYQEEYNQLALDRLLQAKPADEAAKPIPSLEALKVATNNLHSEGSRNETRPQPAAVQAPAVHRTGESNGSTARPRQSGPVILEPPPGISEPPPSV